MTSIHSAKGVNEADAALFDALYAEHHSVLHAYLLGQTSQRDNAADLLQETFVKVCRHIQETRCIPPERRRYWLFAIARNLVCDYRRRQGVRTHLQAALPVASVPDRAPDPAAAVIEQEWLAAVGAAIAALPMELRTVLTMHVVGKMNSVEIGEALSRPAGTVRYQIAQTRRRLAAQFGLQDVPDGPAQRRQR
jgi:RNA polymerase sigma-70 factor (ECF subfamily)